MACIRNNERREALMTETPEPEAESQTYVSIEVDAGLDETWDSLGLDTPPENAEALLAESEVE
ncbi:MAG TPA: hypothetical protein VGN19_05720 [Pedococcus sp.]|nr:hypothetical protein [Pedococcus sp.]